MNDKYLRVRRFLVILNAGFFLFSTAAAAQTSACDLAQPFGAIDAADVQSAVNMALGSLPCTANIAGTGVCNVVVVQRVVNASLPGGTCLTDGVIPRSVLLSWTASISPNVIGYNIYRGTAPGGTYTKHNSSPVKETSYTDNSVQSGQTYYYVTTAVNSSGLESVFSNEAKAVVPSP